MKTRKPAKPYDHRISIENAPVIEVHQDARLAGAWMPFGPDSATDRSPTLHLVSSAHSGIAANYVGYRDGDNHGPDKLAISVEADHAVIIQVVTGTNDVHMLTLAELETAVTNFRKSHPRSIPSPTYS